MKQFLLLLSILATAGVSAADFYWVGGSGPWNDVNRWATSSGGNLLHFATPSANDDVYFDANSFAGAGTVDLLDLAAQCRSLTITGLPAGVEFVGEGTLDVHGSFVADASAEWSYTGGVILLASGGPAQLNAPFYTFRNQLTFAGGADAITVAAPVTATRIRMISGRVDFAMAATLTADRWEVDGASVNYTDLRAEITDEVDLEVENDDIAGLASCRIEFLDNGVLRVQGPAPLGLAEVRSAAGLDVQTGTTLAIDDVIIGGNGAYRGTLAVGNLSFAAGTTHRFAENVTLTVGSWNAVGDCLNPIRLLGAEGATVGADAGAGLSLSNLYVEYLSTTGTATFLATASSGVESDGWTFTDPDGPDRYWVGGTGRWADPAHWALTSGGPGGACPPRPTENALFDAASFAGPGDTVYLDAPAFAATVDWTANDDPTVLAQSAGISPEWYGSVRLHPQLEWVAANNARLRLAGPATGRELLTFGKTEKINLLFDGRGGDWTLADSLSVDYSLFFEAGRFNTAGFPVRAGQLRQFNDPSFVDLGNSTIHIPNYLGMGVDRDGELYFWPANGTGGHNTAGATVRNANEAALLEIRFNGNTDPHHLRALYSSGFVDLRANDFYAETVALEESASLDVYGRIDSLALAAGGEYDFTRDDARELSLGHLAATGDCIDYIRLQAIAPNLTLTATEPVGGSFLQLSNVPASGPAWTAASSLDLGGSPGWMLTDQQPPRTLHWVGGSGNWFEPDSWSLASGGPGGECPPTRLDDVRFDAGSGFTANDTILLYFDPADPSVNAVQPECADFDVRELPVEVRPLGFRIRAYGSVYLAPTFSWAGLRRLELDAAGPAEFLPHGFAGREIIMNGNGTYTLLDSLLAPDTRLTLSGGTFRTDDYFALLENIDFQQSFTDEVILLDIGASTVDLTRNGLNLDMAQAPEGIIRATGGRIRLLEPTTAWFNNNMQGVSFEFLSNEDASAIGMWHYGPGRAPADIPLLRFVGDGRVRGRMEVDTMILSKGQAYRLDDRDDNLVIRGEFRAVGTACNPISIEPVTLGGTSTVNFRSGATAAMDYVRLDRTEADGINRPYAAGANSININDSSDGWRFETNPTVMSLNRFFLGEDADICQGQALTIVPDVPADLVATYLWQDNSTTPTYEPSAPGTYYVEITFDDGECRLTDTVHVGEPVFALGSDADIDVCSDTEVRLHLPDTAALGYEWAVAEGGIIAVDDSSALVAAPGRYFLRQTLGGCVDSVEMVVFNSAPTGSSAVAICPGASLITALGDYTITSDTVITEIYPSVAGCDSSHVTTVTLLPIRTGTSAALICPGTTVSTALASYTVTQDTLITELYTTDDGCDSLHTLAVAVRPTIITAAAESICTGGEFVTAQAVYTVMADTVITEAYTTADGCDSLHTTTLSVLPVLTGSSAAAICPDEPYISPLGQYQIAEDTTLTELYRTAAGCDSLHTTAITVLLPAVGQSTVTTCPGSPMLTPLGEYAVTTDTTITEVYTSAAGCDSVHTLTVIVLPALTGQSVNYLCEPGVFSTALDEVFFTRDTVFSRALVTTAGCDSVHTYDLRIVTQPPALAAARATPVSCGQTANGAINLTADDDLTYTLDGLPVGNGPTIFNLAPGEYVLAAETTSGCVYDTVMVVEEAPEILMDLPRPLEIFERSGIRPAVFVSGGLEPYTYDWSVSDTSLLALSCTNCPDPVLTGSESATLLLTVTDAAGCTVRDVAPVIVNIQLRAFLPEAFSPNADGINDFLAVYGAPGEFTVEEAIVYNRWGGQQAAVTELQPGDLIWDGREAPSGTYAVVCSLLWADGARTQVRGMVNLVR